MPQDLPQDINPAWFSVIRRFQSVSKSQGLSIISISVLVDENGNPKCWTSPVKTLIEPKSAASAIMELFLKG